MELTKRMMIEEYLKSSKKNKSEMITQYCDLTHMRRTTAIKRFERCKRGNVKSKGDRRRNMNRFMNGSYKDAGSYQRTVNDDREEVKKSE
ncbi:MAG: hypothetical protein KBE50_04275 [Fervidobacterium sp.]|nr:hypothetical protein [Fervidobacterium sp.]